MKCSMCSKQLSNKQNLERHIKLIHSVNSKKYFKHIKKDGKCVCKICGKLYTHSHNLKIHYAQQHSKKQIKESMVPIEPIVHFAQKKALAIQENAGFIRELEEQKRNSFVLLNKETSAAIEQLKFQVPLLRMLALDGARQSHL